MSNTNLLRLAVVVVALGVGGCGDYAAPSRPTREPESTPPTSPTPAPAGNQPFVTSITPNVGSVDGNGWSRVTGSGFQTGAMFQVDGTPVVSFVLDSSAAIFYPAPHPAGAVDVLMINPGGLSARLPAGYTYAPPSSFDFNGHWVAHAGDDYDTEMQLRI